MVIITRHKILLARLATVFLLLGKKEEVLGTTLHPVEVIINVQKDYGDTQSAHDESVRLASHPGVRDDHHHERDLHEGDGWHGESLLDGLHLFGGFWGVLFHALAVSGHFYYLLRK